MSTDYKGKLLMEEPVLYILMRSDMDSLNPGKAMAQASHATSMFYREIQDNLAGPTMVKLFKKWTEQADGFGTCIVLDVLSEDNLYDYVDKSDNYFEENDDSQTIMVYSGVVVDPTYPVKDGSVIHLVPVSTCGYVFTTKKIGDLLFKDLELYK